MPTDPNLAALEDLVPDEEQDTLENPVETEAPVEDTPTDHTDPPAPVVDFEKRYKDLQAEFTRRAQRDAERDEQLRTYQEQIEALQARQPYSPQFDEDDDEEFYDDPSKHPTIQAGMQRIAQLEAQLAQQREQDTLQRQADEESHYIDGELDRIESQFKIKLDDDESAIIGREALANRDPLTGRPDVEGAYATYHRILEGRKKQWVEGKRSAPAPATGPGAVEVPDLDDPEQLEEFLDRAFSAS